MSAALKPSEVLARAAELIEPEGAWTQGKFYSDDGGCCAVGAVCKAAAPADWNIEDVAFGLIRRVTGADAVAAWNDAPERTQPEVVAALRKASELAKAEGQ